MCFALELVLAAEWKKCHLHPDRSRPLFGAEGTTTEILVPPTMSRSQNYATLCEEKTAYLQVRVGLIFCSIILRSAHSFVDLDRKVCDPGFGLRSIFCKIYTISLNVLKCLEKSEMKK